MKDLVEKALTESFIVDLYSSGKKITPLNNYEYLGFCPFHEDKNKKSFTFNGDPSKLGIYKCHTACGAQGNIYDFIRKKLNQNKPLIWLSQKLNIHIDQPDNKINKIQTNVDENERFIPTEVILRSKKNLLINFPLKLKYFESLGISLEVIKKYNIGYEKGRFWIPIKNDSGKFVNVRKYDPESESNNKVISYATGYGKNRLWPIENLNSSKIYIFEGEKDTLLANSLNLNALTNTGGAMSWKSEWGKYFLNKNVIICMDIDEAGIEGAKIRSNNISPFVSQIKIIHLPLDKTKYPKGDFSDYINSEENTVEDFLKIVEETTPEFSDQKKGESKEISVVLSEASKHYLINKKCCIKNVRCCGKDTSPFAVPKKVVYKCTGSRVEKKCTNCSLNKKDFTHIFLKDDSCLLGLIKVNEDIVDINLKK